MSFRDCHAYSLSVTVLSESPIEAALKGKGKEMRNSRGILVSGLIVLCLAVLPGCGKKAGEEESPDKLVLEPSVGIGPVKFGMSKAEIIEHFGQPDKIIEGPLTKINYVSSQGLIFNVDAKLGLQEIGCWSEGMLPSGVSTFAGSTTDGIGMGSSQEDITAAYGQPDRTSTNTAGGFQIIHYDTLGTKFWIKGGAAMCIILEAPK